MIFVGSREYLHYISNDFKDVWITLVRSFNRFPKRNLDTNKARENLSSLKEKVNILKAAVIRKNQSIQSDESGDARLETLKSNSAGLIVALESLEKELDRFSNKLPPKNISLSYKNIISSLAGVELKLKEVRNLIAIFGKSYVEVTRRSLFKRSLVFTAEAVVGLLAVGTLTQTLQQGLVYLAKDLPKKKDGLAILISYAAKGTIDAASQYYGTNKLTEKINPQIKFAVDKWIGKFGKLYLPAYVARIELAFGQKADLVIKGATSKDLFGVIKNDSIQNIVIFGHGSWFSWYATDGEMISYELEHFKERKRGLLIRHTCGPGQTLYDQKFFYLSKEQENKLTRLIEKYNSKIAPFYLSFRKSIEPGMDTITKNYYYNISIVVYESKQAKMYNFSLSFSDKKEIESFKGNLKSVLKDKFYDSSELDEILKIAKDISNKVKTFYLEDDQLLGIPVFKRQNIKGWNRIAHPIDFLINVFGQADTKRDQLYAKV